MIIKAEENDLKLIDAIDLSLITGYPYYYCFSSSKLFMWLIKLVFFCYYLLIYLKAFF